MGDFTIRNVRIHDNGDNIFNPEQDPIFDLENRLIQPNSFEARDFLQSLGARSFEDLRGVNLFALRDRVAAQPTELVQAAMPSLAALIGVFQETFIDLVRAAPYLSLMTSTSEYVLDRSGYSTTGSSFICESNRNVSQLIGVTTAGISVLVGRASPFLRTAFLAAMGQASVTGLGSVILRGLFRALGAVGAVDLGNRFGEKVFEYFTPQDATAQLTRNAWRMHIALTGRDVGGNFGRWAAWHFSPLIMGIQALAGVASSDFERNTAELIQDSLQTEVSALNEYSTFYQYILIETCMYSLDDTTHELNWNDFAESLTAFFERHHQHAEAINQRLNFMRELRDTAYEIPSLDQRLMEGVNPATGAVSNPRAFTEDLRILINRAQRDGRFQEVARTLIQPKIASYQARLTELGFTALQSEAGLLNIPRSQLNEVQTEFLYGRWAQSPTNASEYSHLTSSLTVLRNFAAIRRSDAALGNQVVFHFPETSPQ